ncbi:MAG: hypothetical protein KatS3mg003_1447 [Candidatus Nitrosocaldaceae archaeon]|nr:MAG: hypothetical protein KatS3mg003_1447 [Candidatus Nitrosocaldaceae archaeon]
MRSFIKDLKDSDIDEDRVIEFLSEYFNAECYSIENKGYGIILQRLGIDYYLIKDDRIITVQKKIRDDRYYMRDILIELYHIDSNNKKHDGNFYAIKADYLLYLWQENNELLSRGLLINVNKLKRWFYANNDRYEIVKSEGTYCGNRRWITYNKIIPIQHLDSDIYKEIIL